VNEMIDIEFDIEFNRKSYKSYTNTLKLNQKLCCFNEKQQMLLEELLGRYNVCLTSIGRNWVAFDWITGSPVTNKDNKEVNWDDYWTAVYHIAAALQNRKLKIELYVECQKLYHYVRRNHR